MPYDDPFLPIVGQWIAKVRAAFDQKGKRFQKDADEGMKFFAGPYDFLYSEFKKKDDRHFRQTEEDDDNPIRAPRFQMTHNKASELVQLFGPVLYHRNPNRKVNPREFLQPDPSLFGNIQDPTQMMMLQQTVMQSEQLRAIDKSRAKLLEYYLNYTPNALDLKTESQWAVVEALITGASCLWSEMYQPPAGAKMPGSFFDSVKNLLIDPDATSLGDALWICRRVEEPIWKCERKFGYGPGYLKGQMESKNHAALVSANPEGPYLRATGQTCDRICYYEIWSKCGIGGRLSGIDQNVVANMEQFGDYCYLAVCDGVCHPLNTPDEIFDMVPAAGMAEIKKRIQWETPYWADGTWPVSLLGFHWIPGDPWPQSHLSPGMGELKFLNWAFSMMAGKIQISCRDFIALLEEATESVKEAIFHGADYELIRLKGSTGKKITDIVQFLKMPPFSMDIWKVIEAVGEQFEKRVGLTELVYGMSSRQDRSATESAAKRDQMNVRPDDMANRVEDWMSEVARKEAIAARFHLTGQDVSNIVGPIGASIWDQIITPSDPAELLYSLEYRIEAGSVRKPNRDRDAQNAKDLMTALMPFAQNLAMGAAFVEPYNAIVTAYCAANDMKTDGLLLPKLTPPPMPPAAPAGAPQGAAA